ncbi:unnamed protein product [Amoebophrya sp. A120]|nr:unnamed protein product [Amoebophrya sp. A120]|eukprot:GSA120T00025992001.1
MEQRRNKDKEYATNPNFQHLPAPNLVETMEKDPAQKLAMGILKDWKRKLVELDVGFTKWMESSATGAAIVFRNDSGLFTVREEQEEKRHEAEEEVGSLKLRRRVDNVTQALKYESEGRAGLYHAWDTNLAYTEQAETEDVRRRLEDAVENKLAMLPHQLLESARGGAFALRTLRLEPDAKDKIEAKKRYLRDAASVFVGASVLGWKLAAWNGADFEEGETSELREWKEQAKRPANKNEEDRHNERDFFLHNFQLHRKMAQSILGGPSLGSLDVHLALRREAAAYEAKLHRAEQREDP